MGLAFVGMCLAAALTLPEGFPDRDLILISGYRSWHLTLRAVAQALHLEKSMYGSSCEKRSRQVFGKLNFV